MLTTAGVVADVKFVPDWRYNAFWCVCHCGPTRVE